MRTFVASLLALTAVACTDPAVSAGNPGDAKGGADAAIASDAGPDGGALADTAKPDAGLQPIDVAFACTGTTMLLYDPAGPKQITTFPDEFYTVDDPKTATGVRVQFDPALPWIKTGPKILSRAFEDLNALDGWGVTAAVTFRFDAPVGAHLPSGPTSVDAAGLLFADLGPIGQLWAKPERVPFEVQLTDEGRTVLLWPMRPLRPKHRHAVVWTLDQPADDGFCIQASAALRQILRNNGGDPRLDRLSWRAQEALAALGIQPSEVSALAVFTTQSTTDLSIKVAKDIAGRAFAWSGPATCEKTMLFRKCDRPFVAHDYRDGRVVQDGTPQKPWTLTVSVWLPNDAKGPVPAAVFGHGLGSGRSQGKALAELAAPQGIATVAVDAPAHGDHPGANPKPQGTLPTVIQFFGLDVATLSVDGLKLRDHWRQATYDKLQLVQLLLADPDIDGDGKADLDTQKLMYLGVSLGGIMGSELLALTPHLKAAVLSVPGARVSSIISDSQEFAPLIFAFKPDGTSDGDVIRFFPMLQTLLDAGDAGAYAPHVSKDRLAGAGPPPHLLMQMAMNDEIVPNTANRVLARALGLGHAPPVAAPVGLLPVLGPLPVKGNLPGGVSGVLFQFDRATTQKGKPPEPSAHGNVPKCAEAMAQDLHFLQSWMATGVAEVIDPYALLGTPALGSK
ncbi:MAG: hypothetical protein FJ100_08780 [Deltaproteobacteria bacterium]|nr:hypothetical protein [Deltaproteobacteria bacterium]